MYEAASLDAEIVSQEGTPCQLSDSEWKPMDEKKCKISLFEVGDKFRIGAVSGANVAHINAFLDPEYPFNPPKDNFVSFFGVTNGQSQQFAVKFDSPEEAEKFAGNFNSCLTKLKSKQKSDKQNQVEKLTADIEIEEKLLIEEEKLIASMEEQLIVQKEKLEKQKQCMKSITIQPRGGKGNLFREMFGKYLSSLMKIFLFFFSLVVQIWQTKRRENLLNS